MHDETRREVFERLLDAWLLEQAGRIAAKGEHDTRAALLELDRLRNEWRRRWAKAAE